MHIKSSLIIRKMAAAAVRGEKIRRLPSSPEEISAFVAEIVPILRRGGVVALPTDTIYGFACLAQNAEAVKRLYDIKGRDSKKPVAICLKNTKELLRYGDTKLSEDLFQDLFPGRVTVLLRRSQILNPVLNPDASTVGVRIPGHGFVNALTMAAGEPLALTSANKSNAQSSLTIEEFSCLWPQLDLVVDQGRIMAGKDENVARIGSTIVDLSIPNRYKVVRAGSEQAKIVNVLRNHGLTCLDS